MHIHSLVHGIDLPDPGNSAVPLFAYRDILLCRIAIITALSPVDISDLNDARVENEVHLRMLNVVQSMKTDKGGLCIICAKVHMTRCSCKVSRCSNMEGKGERCNGHEHVQIAEL